MLQIHALFSSVTLAGSKSQPVFPSPPATSQPDPSDEHRAANEPTVIAQYEVSAPPPRPDAQVASPRSEQILPPPVDKHTDGPSNDIQATATDDNGISSGKRCYISDVCHCAR